MNKLLLCLVIAGILSQSKLHAQKTETKFVQITTIESVMAGGLGRSKMLITKEDGSQEEREMNNLFSLVGINFRNIKENETSIISVLKTYTDNGWRIFSATPLTLSPTENITGIFMTRYLLVKEEERK